MQSCLKRLTRIEAAIKIRCMSVRGWGIRKVECVCKELKEWNLDIVMISEALEHALSDCGEFMVSRKGRKKEEKLKEWVAGFFMSGLR